jgi:hypothetical protein
MMKYVQKDVGRDHVNRDLLVATKGSCCSKKPIDPQSFIFHRYDMAGKQA